MNSDSFPLTRRQLRRPLQWDVDSGFICENIRSQKANLKFLVKVKDQPQMLVDWIIHHEKIVGLDNLIIADNMSCSDSLSGDNLDSRIFRILFQFTGAHNYIHDQDIFFDLYEAIRSSCDYYVVMDADERFIWTDGAKWLADQRVVSIIKEKEGVKLLRCGWIENFALKKSNNTNKFL